MSHKSFFSANNLKHFITELHSHSSTLVSRALLMSLASEALKDRRKSGGKKPGVKGSNSRPQDDEDEEDKDDEEDTHHSPDLGTANTRP